MSHSLHVFCREAVLGFTVRIELIDCFAHDVRRMLDDGSLDAISGWHTSAIREALAPLAAGSIPYVYPAFEDVWRIRG